MNDLEKLITYNDEKKQGSITPFIISLSFYSNKILPEKGPLEKKISFEKISFRLIISMSIKITKKNESFQKRFKFIFREETIKL